MKKLSVPFVIFLIISINIKAQNVGIGSNNPSQKLQVGGNIKGDTAILEGIKITDNAVIGGVLTSNDAAGNAKWVKPVKVFFKASGWTANFDAHNGVDVKLNKWKTVDFAVGVNGIFGDFYYNPIQGDFFVLRPGVYRVSVRVYCETDSPDPRLGGHRISIKKNDVIVATSFNSIPEYSYFGITTFESSSKYVSTLLNLNSQDKITLHFVNTLLDGSAAQFKADYTTPVGGSFNSNIHNEFTIEKVD